MVLARRDPRDDVALGRDAPPHVITSLAALNAKGHDATRSCPSVDLWQSGRDRCGTGDDVAAGGDACGRDRPGSSPHRSQTLHPRRLGPPERNALVEKERDPDDHGAIAIGRQSHAVRKARRRCSERHHSSLRGPAKRMRSPRGIEAGAADHATVIGESQTLGGHIARQLAESLKTHWAGRICRRKEPACGEERHGAGAE